MFLPDFQTSEVSHKATGLAGGVLSLLQHFHPQSQDGASLPSSSPAQIMVKANNGQRGSIQQRFGDGSGGGREGSVVHVELLTSAPSYKDVPLATGDFIEPLASVIL